MKNWRADPIAAPILRAFELYANGAAIDECGELAHLLTDHLAAMKFVEKWQDLFLEALSQEPLGQIPNRHNYAAGLATMQLFSAQGATLSLLAYEALDNAREPQSALFVDREIHEVVLAGEARGHHHRICKTGGPQAEIESSDQCWRVGAKIALRPRDETRQFVEINGMMLVLQLARSPQHPLESREYSLTDGSLIHQASGDKRASQDFIALDVLGALGRQDAIPAMEQMALNAAREANLRWEAVRQLLSLNAAKGMALLNRLIANNADPLSQPAQSLRQSLTAANSRLKQLAQEAGSCRT
ncbi:MAG: hypothetical protein ABJP48_03280 [Erythrobacter sp.]